MLGKTLVIGGSGLLGRNIRSFFPEADFPTHKEMDITNPKTLKGDYDTVIHLAGYTDVVKAEKDINVYEINVTGTYNMVKAFPDAKFIYMSSEYVKNPVNKYSETKLLGELIVTSTCNNYLIIRTLFKKTPFDYDKAFIDQMTTGDYVDVIAKMVAEVIYQEKTGIVDVGTGRKTMFDLARRTKPDIEPISVDDIKTVKLPKDYK